MTGESITALNLSLAMTTTEAQKTHSTDGTGMTPSYSFDVKPYFEFAVVFSGVVGTAGNALVLYALLASKQHKKHVLIVNQNALDLFASFFIIVIFSLRMCNIHLTGVLGYWLCIVLLGEYFVWVGTNGSILNLAIITVDRYLKVVHPVWSREGRSSGVESKVSASSGDILRSVILMARIDPLQHCYDLQDKRSEKRTLLFFFVL